ncbi:quinon protein alcohol dehydrogenase-like superfamily [Mycena vitilis]|nr:quinon protein alcohol dehydrogenase-like superfamily [Mycena vitilis]
MDQYKKYSTLVPDRPGKAHAVNALVFFEHGTLLASDDQVVRIWDIRSGDCLQELKDTSWGQILNLSLLVDTIGQLLFVGTARGVVSIFPWEPVSNRFVKPYSTATNVFKLDEAVESQAIDRVNSRFAAGSRAGQIKMYSIRDRRSLDSMWTIEVEQIPRGLFFVGEGNEKALTMYTLKPGPVLSFNSATGAYETATGDFRGGVGFVALSPTGREQAIHNISEDKFEIHKLGSSSPVCLSVSANSGKIKGAVFAEGGNTLICGGDDGFLHIFDVTRAAESQSLTHADCSTIYAVAAHTSEDYHLIASGESENPAHIYVWVRPTERKVLADRRKQMEHEAEVIRVAKEKIDRANAAELARIAEEQEQARQAKMADLTADFNRLWWCLLTMVAILVAFVGYTVM